MASTLLRSRNPMSRRHSNGCFSLVAIANSCSQTLDRRAIIARDLKLPLIYRRSQTAASKPRIAVGMTLITFTITSTSFGQTPPHKGQPRIVPTAPIRLGDRSLESTIRTDERYGHDCLFQGPSGWCDWNFLENSKPIQSCNVPPEFHWPPTRRVDFCVLCHQSPVKRHQTTASLDRSPQNHQIAVNRRLAL